MRHLVEQVQVAGHHAVTWDGKDDGGRAVASGVYLYRLSTGRYDLTRTMVLAK